MKWPIEHKRLLNTNLTNEQIAKITGRTVIAVGRARYYWTGHTYEKGRQLETAPEKISKVEGECRVIDMARKLNIKILDVF